MIEGSFYLGAIFALGVLGAGAACNTRRIQRFFVRQMMLQTKGRTLTCA
jgi:hypothetical protein